MINFQRTQLANGLRIITAPQKETKAMSLLFLVGVGSRYETKELGGISHFLEHILFKGTKKYPGPQILAIALDEIGANFNAFTSEECTGFYICAASSHFPLALDILHEMFYAPRFAHADVEREKGVIVEEINMYRDLPQRHVHDLIKRLIYGDTPLGRNIAGQKETVTNFHKSTFLDYQNDFYTPDNIIISVAGNQNNYDWLSEIKKLFRNKTSTKARQFEAVIKKQNQPQVLTEYKKTDQTHLTLACSGLAETDERIPTLIMLETILGGLMSSRLFNEIREKRGLAYYIRAGKDSFHDNGYFVVSSGIRNSHVKAALKIIIRELAKVKNQKIPAKELRRAKENFKGQLALGLEDSFAVANYFASQELYFNKQFQPEELIDRIEAVTDRQLMTLANELFLKEQLSLAAVGPFKDSDLLPILATSKL